MTNTTRFSPMLLSLIASVPLTLGWVTGQASHSDEAAHRAHDSYVAAINSNHLESFLATITDDAVFLPPNSPAITGKAAVGAWAKDYLAAYQTKWEKTSKE